MKVLVLLSLVAFCASQSTLSGNHISIDKDGAIVIVGHHGSEIDIHRNVLNQRQIDIILRNILGPLKKFIIDEVETIHKVDINTLDSKLFSSWNVFKNLGHDYTQHDVLVHLFGDYQGLVDSEKYHNLVEKIHFLVNNGVLHKSIWELVKYLDNYDYQQEDLEKYVPHHEKHGLEHYGYENEQKLSPLQKLYYGLQQKYKQGLNEEHSYQQHNTEYQNENLQRPYEYYLVNPWIQKIISNWQRSPLAYAYYGKYQTPLAQEYYHQKQYPQGYYHQQEYSQGLYHHQEYPQGVYHKQQYPKDLYHQQEYSQGSYHQQEYSQGPYHQEEYSQELDHQQEYPEGVYHQQEYPQGLYHQQEYPQGVYHNKQQYPEGRYHQQEYPQGVYHKQQYPEGLYHQQEYPQGLYHQQEYSQGVYHNKQQYPEGRYHQQEYPQGLYHQQEYSQGVYHNKQQYPEGRYHQQEYPQGLYHQQEYSQGVYHNKQQYPEGRYHQQEYPQGLYHEEEYPQGLYHQQEYSQGLYHQQEYPQGYYKQQQYPQSYYYQQGYPLLNNQEYSHQWNPLQYKHYQGQVDRVEKAY